MRLMAGSRSRWWAQGALCAVICLMAQGSPSAQKIDPKARSIDDRYFLPVDKAAVSIVSDQQMDFGQIADRNGSVVLGLADAIVSDPQFIHYGGTPYSAICTITGDPSTAVDVSISTVGPNGLSLSNFTSSEGNIPLVAATLDPSGELVLTIGATLTIDDAQASVGAGQTVSYTITTIYN